MNELTEWPPAARHIITGISKADRDEYDEERCGPVYTVADYPQIDLSNRVHPRYSYTASWNKWTWCNEGHGPHGHINSGGDGPICSWCGVKL